MEYVEFQKVTGTVTCSSPSVARNLLGLMRFPCPLVSIGIQIGTGKAARVEGSSVLVECEITPGRLVSKQ